MCTGVYIVVSKYVCIYTGGGGQFTSLSSADRLKTHCFRSRKYASSRAFPTLARPAHDRITIIHRLIDTPSFRAPENVCTPVVGAYSTSAPRIVSAVRSKTFDRLVSAYYYNVLRVCKPYIICILLDPFLIFGRFYFIPVLYYL